MSSKMTSSMSSKTTSSTTSSRPRTPLGKRAAPARRKPLMFTAILNPLGIKDEPPAPPKPKFKLKRRRARGLPSLTPIGNKPARPSPLSPLPQVRVRRPFPEVSPPVAPPAAATLADLAAGADHRPQRLGRAALGIGGQVFVASLGAMAMLFGSEWLISQPAAAFPPQAAIWTDGDDEVRFAEPRPLPALTRQPQPEPQAAAIAPHETPADVTLTASAPPIAPLPRPRPQVAGSASAAVATTAAAARPSIPAAPVPRRHPTRVVSLPADAPTTLELGSVAPSTTVAIQTQEQASLTPVDPITTIPPYRFMRMMSALQDDIARGSQQALEAQSALSRRATDVFVGAPADAWEDIRNVRALLQYSLAGADPSIVSGALQNISEDHPWQPLLQGALAYNEGRQGDALRRLGALNMLEVDPGVRGSLHLALAALTVGRDPNEALEHLADARAIAPGSLVEEASLRRAILIAGETDDAERLIVLTGRYLRKFRGSIYAGNFRQRFASSLTRMSFIRDIDGFDRLDTLLAGLSEGARTEQYLLIARSALEFGEPIAAAAAAKRALVTAEPGTLDETRAKLYEAAALVVDTQNTVRARETLAEINTELLPAADVALHTAALRVGEGVARLPGAAVAPAFAADFSEPADFTSIGSGPRVAPTDPNDPFAEPGNLLASVTDQLAATDELLEQFQ